MSLLVHFLRLVTGLLLLLSVQVKAETIVACSWGGAASSSWKECPLKYLASTKFTSASVTRSIDMSEPSLPTGIPEKVFQTSIASQNKAVNVQVPAANGKYTVTLLFAETKLSSNQRAFQVFIEDKKVQQTIDIYSNYGKDVAVAKTYTVNIVDGLINIRIVKKGNNDPVLSGMLIISENGGTSPPTITPTVLVTKPSNFAPIALNYGGSKKGSFKKGGSKFITSTFKSWTAPKSTLIDFSHPSLPPSIVQGVFRTFIYTKMEGDLILNVPLSKGKYKIWLMFAEGIVDKSNERKMGIMLEGNIVLDSFDIYAEVGKNKGIAKTFVVDVIDGKLNIQLTRKLRNPILSGLLIEQVSSETNPTKAPILKPTKKPTAGPTEQPTEQPTTKPTTKPTSPASSTLITLNYGGPTQGSWKSASQGNGKFQYLAAKSKTFSSVDTVDTSSSLLPEGVPEDLFKSHVWNKNSLEFAIPLVNGNYRVVLLFAENFFSEDGKRVFNIEIEGSTVLTDLDLHAELGQNVAGAKEFQVTILDGMLNIDLVKKIENPLLCGILIGSGGKTHGDTFLHVVIDVPEVILDESGSGKANVALQGSGSHTHEFGVNLKSFAWEYDNKVFSKKVDTEITLPIGRHDIGLTITDDKSPPESLYGSTEVVVVPLDQVPGCEVYSYPTIDPGSLLSTTSIDVKPDAGYVLDETKMNAPGQGGSNGGIVGRLYVLKALVHITSPAEYQFGLNGGGGSKLYLDGKSIGSQKVLLEIGTHNLEARFAMSKGSGLSSEWPISVTRKRGSGVFQILSSAETSFNAADEAPVLNRITPDSGALQGGNTVRIEGVGFLPWNKVEVMWGEKAIGNKDLSITPTSITLVAPSAPIKGQVSIKVENGIGISNEITFTYESFGGLPIDFSKPKTIHSVNQPTVGTFGPDGKLYIGTVSGKVHVLELDEDYKVKSSQVLDGVKDSSMPAILGIAFNPAESGPLTIYIAHGDLFAQGGFCLKGQVAPYAGQVSTMSAPDFLPEPLITNLPVSNHDHSVNGMDFDAEGNLYVAVGGNTNAGIKACQIGDLPESPFSAAIIKAEVLKPDFRGHIRYINRKTGEEDMDQANGDKVDPVEDVDLSVFASGFRNAVDLAFAQSGKLYATDNGPNKNYGPSSTGPNKIGKQADDADEVNYVIENMYYGHPNPSRASSAEGNELRQWVYYDRDAPSIPGVFRQTMAKVSASTNGIFEYMAQPFNGALRGQLILQKYKGNTFNLPLTPDGEHVSSTGSDDIPNLQSLDVTPGPGGAIIGISYSSSSIKVILPVISAPADDCAIYDIFPWRSVMQQGKTFVIGGRGFLQLVQPSLYFDEFKATITSITNKRITGVLPFGESLPQNKLMDVVLKSGNKASIVYSKAFQYLNGGALASWRQGPPMPVELGEVAIGIIGNIMYVIGEGNTATLAYNFNKQKWLTTENYAVRPHPGNHHMLEVYGGKLYVIGGLKFSSEGKVQIYDPATNEWTFGQECPIASGSGNTALIGSKIYYCGGIKGSETVDDCDVYDIINDQWLGGIASMPFGRNHAASTTDGELMYVFGGRDGGNKPGDGFDEVQIYNPATNTWKHSKQPGSNLQNLPQERGGTGKAFYANGKIFVIAGESCCDVYKRVDVYDPISSTWTRYPDMPFGMHGVYPVPYAGRIYIAGGGINVGNSKTDYLMSIPLNI